MTSLSRVVSLFALALTIPLCSGSSAQVTQQVGLSQRTYQLFELNTAFPSDTVTFEVNTSRMLTFDIMSKSSAVNVDILMPSGAPVDPALVERFSVGPGDVPPLGAVLFEEGFHVQAHIPSPLPGQWTIRLSLPAGVAEAAGNVGVFVTGGLSAGLTMSRPSYQVSDTAVVALFAFREDVPVTGAVVTANVYSNGPGAKPVAMELRDDGQNADATAGDGVYTGGVAGLSPGHYLVEAEVQVGVDRAMGATHFDVTADLARLAGTKTDLGIDTNADGLFDWIGVDVGLTVATAGTYAVFASLATPSGSEEVSAAGEAALAIGSRSVRVRFAAARIREALRSNGPWMVRDIRLVPVSSNGVAATVLADQLPDLGFTQPYALTQLQRPITQILQGTTDRAIDTNGNGLFDLLQMTFQVDTLRTGSYTWTGNLRTADGTQIAVSTGQGSVAAGVTTLGFTFDGKAIGTSGLDGPYGLYDVAIYGPPGAATLRPVVGPTQAYTASQFEGSRVTFQRLLELVEALPIFGLGGVPVTDLMKQSLLQKVRQAQEQAERGQTQAAIGMLGAFVNEMQGLGFDRIHEPDQARIIEFLRRLELILQTR